MFLNQMFWLNRSVLKLLSLEESDRLSMITNFVFSLLFFSIHIFLYSKLS